MRFRFTIGDRVFHAEMVDNDIVREVARHLPLEASYSRYAEHEYYTRLPFPTTDGNCKKEFDARKNEVWYFAGWNAFTILFGDCNTAPFEVVRLGEMEEDIASFLCNAGRSLRILCELEEE